MLRQRRKQVEQLTVSELWDTLLVGGKKEKEKKITGVSIIKYLLPINKQEAEIPECFAKMTTLWSPVNLELMCIFSLVAGTFALFCLQQGENGLQSGPHLDPAATPQRQLRRSRARGGDEDEVESEVDGGAAGGQTEQRLSGE